MGLKNCKQGVGRKRLITPMVMMVGPRDGNGSLRRLLFYVVPTCGLTKLINNNCN